MAVTTPVSPKVKAGAAWSALSGVLVIGLTAIATGMDPHLFDSFGPWGAVITLAITTGAGALGAYLKRDKLRDAGADAIAAQETVVAAQQVASASYPTTPAEESVAPAPGTFGDPSVTNQE